MDGWHGMVEGVGELKTRVPSLEKPKWVAGLGRLVEARAITAVIDGGVLPAIGASLRT